MRWHVNRYCDWENGLSPLADEAFTARLLEVVEAAGGQNALARKTGLSQSGIARLTSGGEPTLSTLKAIAKASNRSLVWLVEGRDEQGDSDGPARSVAIPILDLMAGAGSAVDNGEVEVVGHITFDEAALARYGVKPDNVRALRCRGISMEPTISDNALVLVNTAKQPLVDGHIYALRAPEGLRIKRIQRHMDGAVLLISDNREMFEPERLAPDEAEQVRVLGRVFWTEKLL
jgi:phage repressor protein C with HTH and peptisase S24 domain